MIDFKDIKIGNYIMVFGPGPSKYKVAKRICDLYRQSVDGRWAAKVENYDLGFPTAAFDLGICDGVKLTPEILEKCGFIKYDSETYGVRYDLKIEKSFAAYDNGFTYELTEKELHFAYYCSLKIEYLHQLQNLYYCLTGEELKIEIGFYTDEE